LKDHRLCCSYKLYDGNIFAQTRFDMCLRTKHVCVHCKHVLVDAIYVYSYSLGMVLQQKRLEANKVDDCKCFAHDKKTKCLRDKTFRPNFRQSILRKTMQKLPRRIC